MDMGEFSSNDYSKTPRYDVQRLELIEKAAAEQANEINGRIARGFYGGSVVRLLHSEDCVAEPYGDIPGRINGENRVLLNKLYARIGVHPENSQLDYIYGLGNQRPTIEQVRVPFGDEGTGVVEELAYLKPAGDGFTVEASRVLWSYEAPPRLPD